MLARPRIRQLSLGELLDESFRLYRDNFLMFVAITALIFVPYSFLSFVVQYPMQDQLAELQSQANQGFATTTPDAILQLYTDLFFWYIGLLVVALLYSVIFQPLLEGALVYAVSQRYLGRVAGVGDSFGAALRRSPALIGARLIPTLLVIAPPAVIFAIVAFLGYRMAGQSETGDVDLVGPIMLMMVGLLGFFVFFIMLLVGALLMVRIFFTSQVVMVEHAGPWQSIGRSWRLTQGYFWRTLGYWIIIGLLVYALMLGPGLILQWLMQLFQVDLRIQLVVNTCVGAVLGVIVMPYNLIAYTLMYYDLRIRKEGFDLEQQASSLLTPGLGLSALESR